MKKLFILIKLVLIFPCFIISQSSPPIGYRDGVFEPENSPNRRFIPYTYLREADVAFKKRIWRRIDLREKINLPLYYPTDYNSSQTRISLIQLLKKYIYSGEIIAFDQFDEQFLIPLPTSDAKKMFLVCFEDKNALGDNNTSYDANGNPLPNPPPPPQKCDSTYFMEDMRSLLIKEDFFFDKQKSILDVRIIGICPVKVPRNDEGKPKDGEIAKMFWVYFPACRPIFAKHEVFNPRNPAENRTFDDIFWKRQFSSTIVKEENVYDRDIEEYLKGIDNLLEAERIKNELFKWEHDLWHL